MSEFVIENDVTQPPVRVGRKLKYPYADMLVGQSFFVSNDASNVLALRSSVSYFCLKHTGYRFSVRKVDGGHRVWRIDVDGASR